ncbi:MAG: XdhC family protein [Wenzhouxiangellaceae bacterium]
MSAGPPSSSPWLADEVLPQWLEWQRQGLRPLLATLVRIEGSSPRPLGAQMAIVDEQRWAGFLSGGCVEAAIITEALAVRSAGGNRLQRYGHGSPYVDLQLPCGSAIEVYFDQAFPAELAAAVVEAGRQRLAQQVLIDYQQHRSTLASADAEAAPGVLLRMYRPPLRLHIVGLGPTAGMLAELASHSGLEVIVHTPDQATAELLAGVAQVNLLNSAQQPLDAVLDRYSALVTLYHEHAWEMSALKMALSSEAGYIGALGSRRTHQQRLDQLQQEGFSAEQCQQIHGPAGLFHSARQPTSIAISILAEIFCRYNRL